MKKKDMNKIRKRLKKKEECVIKAENRAKINKLKILHYIFMSFFALLGICLIMIFAHEFNHIIDGINAEDIHPKSICLDFVKPFENQTLLWHIEHDYNITEDEMVAWKHFSERRSKIIEWFIGLILAFGFGFLSCAWIMKDE